MLHGALKTRKKFVKLKTLELFWKLSFKTYCVLLLLKAAGVTHLGGSISPMEGAAAISGGKSLAKSNWSLVEVRLAAASIVSPSETTELVVLFMVSNDWEGRRVDLRRRLYGLKK